MQKLGRPLSQDWISTSDAATLLGISRGHLLKLKADGTFKRGKHFRDIRRTNAARATYKWHLPNIEKTLNLGPEVR